MAARTPRPPPCATAVPPALVVTQKHGGSGCPSGRVSRCRGIGLRVLLPQSRLRRSEGLRGTGRLSLQRRRLGLTARRASLCRPPMPAQARAGEEVWRLGKEEGTEWPRGPFWAVRGVEQRAQRGAGGCWEVQLTA